MAVTAPTAGPSDREVEGNQILLCADMGLAVVTGPVVQG